MTLSAFREPDPGRQQPMARAGGGIEGHRWSLHRTSGTGLPCRVLCECGWASTAGPEPTVLLELKEHLEDGLHPGHDRSEEMDMQETTLPGVGRRHDLTTRGGHQLGVVSYRTGRRDLLLYHPDDPDTCREVIRLTPEEADALADLLGAGHLTGHLAELQQQIEGLAISWLTIQATSPYAGGTIADTQARSRTGVSIVAVVRGRTAFPAPAPSFGLQAGDTAVVVGTPAGVRTLARLLDG
jgi:TrkA domain protein